MASSDEIPPSLEADFVALRKLRDDDASGALKEFFGDSEDPSKWRGVETADGRVTKLFLYGCTKLTTLPDSIGKLGALTELKLYNCSSLVALPAAIGELGALTELDLDGCSNLEQLPDIIVECEGLTVVLPDQLNGPLQEDFAALRKLRDDDASGALTEYLGASEDPRKWKTSYGEKAVVVADGRVTKLILYECTNLTALPAAIGELKALTELNLSECSSLASLPDAIGELKALTRLNLWGASIALLPVAIGELKALTYLSLQRCSSLVELPEAIGELGALRTLDLPECSSLAALPAAISKLGALTTLDLDGCAKLTFPPPHTHKDGTDRIKRLLANTTRFLASKISAANADDDAKADFLDGPIHHAPFADRLELAVRKDPALADLTNDKGQRAIDLATSVECRRAMQRALYFLGRYDVDKTPALHFSATAAVLGATDYDNDDVKPRRALKAMREPSAVLAELEGRAGLDSKFVVAVVGVHVSKDADAVDRDPIIKAAGRLKISVDKDQDFGSLPGFLAKSDRGEVGNDRYEGFKYLVVMELADRSLGTALLHERIASNEWPLVRKIGGDLARALDALHCIDRIHGDFKPLNIVRVAPQTGAEIAFTSLFSWQLIDLDVSCNIDSDFGPKQPSSGYCPPEMARVLIDALDKKGVAKPEKLGAYECMNYISWRLYYA